jgi:L-alanine-DL-glutamate epimerase-like enolase superfamily enzyme
MGKLFEFRNVIEDKVKGMGADAFKVKGKIGLQSGILIGMIQANTPDDPAQVRALREAIKAVLGVNV